MIKAIFTDMDDTLIVNTVLYTNALFMLKGYLANFGIRAEEVEAVQTGIDKELYAAQGYARTRYPLSFEKTLQHFIPEADAGMIAKVRGFAETVFDTIAPPKPGTIEAISILSELYPVYIVTQGDQSVQQKRIDNLPFRDQIKEAYIVDKKNTQTFADLAAKLGLDPSEIVMIGDSLKSDIVPAVAAGLKAIWIEANNWTLIEQGEMPKHNAFKFASLMEVAEHFETYGDLQGTSIRPNRPTPPDQRIF